MQFSASSATVAAAVPKKSLPRLLLLLLHAVEKTVALAGTDSERQTDLQ